ncbi:LPS export ABC transporter periplasmic protein LptC [Pseudoalteromonas phenolica]|uniref:Lipopolysaccharide export system protein LptC n=1 Tax=Pseudoalteromonas phenolica TaxID=161398 RepID=A0A5S3YZT9_9GAMM|nr:LPS export ABC transporter periplasmic protein LptC [Pseudoalteromonas phenolica]TMN92229.1 LPS export ABC transporter periplasmic protein LptC [Pseudoalteromonas phenolica]TMP83534.1 LPS export ABC transporter periplasmic protein LptC [Pseudoalteromonas phenolica]
MTVSRVVLLIVFIVTMYWLWSPYWDQSAQLNSEQDDAIATPDYIATNLKQTQYSESGQRSYLVEALKMELYQQLGFSHFSSPTFTLFNGPQNWQLSATEATLYENNILILEGAVKAFNLTEGAMINQINAEHIQVDIDKRTMHSDLPVEIVGPHLNVKGQGLNADLNTDIIELINHTRTIYYDQ